MTPLISNEAVDIPEDQSIEAYAIAREMLLCIIDSIPVASNIGKSLPAQKLMSKY